MLSTAFRIPVPPAPIEPFDITHPALPSQLDGLTILHVSDLHVRRSLLHTDRYRVILHALGQTAADIVACTGDYMDEPGCEPAHEAGALETLRALSAAWRPRLGAFAIFGNHDTPEFRRTCIRELPAINFIGGRAIDLPNGLRLQGLDWPEDPLAMALAFPSAANARAAMPARNHKDEPPASPSGPAPALAPAPALPCLGPSFPLTLAHHPTTLIPAAELGLPLLLCGHTHAGQIRLHPRLSPHTSSDLPPHLASGVLQLGTTLCCITRGIGDGVVEGLRINCPRQIPLYTLRRGPLRYENPTEVRQMRAW